MKKKDAYTFYLLLLCGFVVSTACRESSHHALFERIPVTHSGVGFNNLIQESDTFNVLDFEYIYNGGGVAVGDVNNDGLPDLFFAGNQVGSRLYINKGNFVFEDVTEEAGVKTHTWCTGVAMVDINGDGLLDIHVATIQPRKNVPPVPNLFFINKGVDHAGLPTFEESAAVMGLNDSSYSTQAAFLDFDGDGDLDVFLLNNALEDYHRNLPLGQKQNGKGQSTDKLFRNEGLNKDAVPVFTDVSAEAGILIEGWGLGVVVNDINDDGWPDIYVSNDFLSNDLLYVNNGDGTFTNKIASMLKHQQQNGMGMDIADINNDGLNDIVVVDMLPEDNLRQKTMFSHIGYDRFWVHRQKGYQDQYVRNVLQLNNGNNTFSDIGYLAGIYATDWSWSALLADLDNDGHRDIFITNGYVKDITDLDFVAYRKEVSGLGSDAVRRKKIYAEIQKLQGVKKPNVVFHNAGSLRFVDSTASWGLHHASYSNGAAYADLDNDGDLDLVVSNINDEAFIYENNLRERKPQHSRYLRVQFNGNKGNTHGLGAKVHLYYGGKVVYAEHQSQRGYKSNVEDAIHFGLGEATRADSLIVRWPSGKSQKLVNLEADQVVVVNEYQASYQEPPAQIVEKSSHFVEVSQRHHILYRHREERFPDFKQGQAILPRKHSQEGPGLAVGDINGDGMEDLVIGGPAGVGATLFIQQENGMFVEKTMPDKPYEDTGLLLFDADGDGDLDLYCVSGSTEFGLDMEKYQDRLYLNDGFGMFSLASGHLPEIHSSGSCVVAADFDRDGDIDLFVGGRVTPTRYPEPPRSYLLENNGEGLFTDVTDKFCGSLSALGMVSAALWTDYDQDGWTDLLVAGEWMPITFFRNEGGKKFVPYHLENTVGWWNSIAAGDFDNDGDTDYVLGNLGLNSLYQASADEPVSLYAADFDNNGSIDPILTRYIQGKEYPTHPRDALTEQMVSLKKALTSYSKYGHASLDDLLPKEVLKKARTFRATTLSSAYLENRGEGSFGLVPLPVEAQIAPIFGIAVTDVNGDENPDILAVGNSHASDPLTGFYDAGVGLCLLGDGQGNFSSMPLPASGFYVSGDAKALAPLTLKNGTVLFLAAQNQDSLRVFTNEKSPAEIPVEIAGR